MCVKKTKIMTLYNNFFSSMSVFDARSREYHEMEPIFAVSCLQAEEDARCTYYKAAFINMSEDLNREDDL